MGGSGPATVLLPPCLPFTGSSWDPAPAYILPGFTTAVCTTCVRHLLEGPGFVPGCRWVLGYGLGCLPAFSACSGMPAPFLEPPCLTPLPVRCRRPATAPPPAVTTTCLPAILLLVAPLPHLPATSAWDYHLLLGGEVPACTILTLCTFLPFCSTSAWVTCLPPAHLPAPPWWLIACLPATVHLRLEFTTTTVSLFLFHHSCRRTWDSALGSGWVPPLTWDHTTVPASGLEDRLQWVYTCTDDLFVGFT